MTELQPLTTTVGPTALRAVCARWTTGVAVVTGNDHDGGRRGMAVNSFTSLSLDPPLVLFCPGLSSSTWPSMRESGRFAVHVLADDQSAVAGAFARSGGDKFADVVTYQTDDGLPAIQGVAARLVCETESVLPGGDHEIVIGRVIAAEENTAREALVFQRGRIVEPTASARGRSAEREAP